MSADAYSYVSGSDDIVKISNKFREGLLSRGNSEDPMKLYIQFRGQEPNIDELLKRNGLL